MIDELLAVADRVVAMARPGEQVEAVVVRGTDTEIKVYGGEVESLSSAQAQGVGIRVVIDGRQGFAYAGSLDESVIAETLADARDNAGFATFDEYAGLAEPDGVVGPSIELYRSALETFSPEAKVALAIEMERAVLAADRRISGIESAEYMDSISESAVDSLMGQLASHPVDAVVFSDFRHGIFNKYTVPRIASAVPAGAMRVADSQVSNRWGNILEFQGFDLITPNEREARFALGDQDSVVRPLALDLYKKAGCKILILKLGERGIITYRLPSPDLRAFFIIDSFADHVVDAVGSGDALLAYSTLAMVATKSEVISSILGSLAAAVACEREGNNPVSPEDVLKKLELLEKRANFE
jgi:sugar/nucleoside kinase (ribokinase family)